MGSSRFQQGEGPSRGLPRDCTTSPMDRFAALLRTVSGNGRFRFSPPVSSLNIGQRPGAGAAVWRQVR